MKGKYKNFPDYSFYKKEKTGNIICQSFLSFLIEKPSGTVTTEIYGL